MQTTADFDSPWKEAIEVLFPAFMAFFFPDIAAAIDWSRGYEFLGKELEKITRDATLGRRYADKLVKVFLLGGQEAWLLIHIEIQGYWDAGFPKRMYVYNYRIFDRFRRQPYSVAVLADESPGWRPTHFGEAVWDCLATIRFPVVKLSDFRANWSLLEASANPFATVVMAHLKTQETQGNPTDRYRWKWAFTRRLYQLGMARDEIIQLYRFIDWLMRLPDELEAEYLQAIETYEKEQTVTFITYAERIGEERGFQEGKQEGKQEGRQEGKQEGKQEGLLAAIELGLDLKFGADGLALLPTIAKISDLDRLQAIYAALRGTASLAEIRCLAVFSV
jgi:hypothetical protein